MQDMAQPPREGALKADPIKLKEVDVNFADIDALSHDDLARYIAGDISVMLPGSVVGIQGAWGSGKTDLTARIYDFVGRNSAFPPPIWINPWQYGTPDLIRPVVLEMLRRIAPDKRSASETIRRAARTLLRAGNAMLFKAISVVAPFGDIIGAGETHVDELISGLFEGDKAAIDPDPVYAMAERFRELCQEYLLAAGCADGRLVICVDDLDRCLPDHQIAMLEAIYFLTGASADCSFVIALDPTLVQQAAHAHYQTSGFDSEQYLNKLFHLRLNLPPLSEKQISALLESELARTETSFGSVRTESGSGTIEQVFDVSRPAIGAAFSSSMWLPELRNPRLIRRVLDRLWILARRLEAYDDSRLRGEPALLAAVRWCALAERWPDARRIFQMLAAADGDGERNVMSWKRNAEVMCYSFGLYSRESFASNEVKLERALKDAPNMVARLPLRERAPDLGSFLLQVFCEASDDAVQLLLTADEAMVRYGI
jgi:hypothetical protein